MNQFRIKMKARQFKALLHLDVAVRVRVVYRLQWNWQVVWVGFQGKDIEQLYPSDTLNCQRNLDQKKKFQQHICSARNTIIGSVMALGAMTCLLVSKVLTRMNVEVASPADILFIRSVMQSVFTVNYIHERCTTTRHDVKKTFQDYVVITFNALSCSTMVVCAYLGVMHIPVTDFLVISFTSPLMVLLLNKIFHRKREPLVKWIINFLLVVGTVLVIQPGFLFTSTPQIKDDTDWLAGICLAIGSALSNAVFMVTSSSLKQKTSFSFMMMVSAPIILVGALLQMPIKLCMGQFEGLEWNFAVGFFSWAGSGLVYYANQFTKPTMVGSIRTLEIPISAILNHFLTDEDFNEFGYVGIALIFAVNIINPWTKSLTCHKCRDTDSPSSGPLPQPALPPSLTVVTLIVEETLPDSLSEKDSGWESVPPADKQNLNVQTLSFKV